MYSSYCIAIIEYNDIVDLYVLTISILSLLNFIYYAIILVPRVHTDRCTPSIADMMRLTSIMS